ncbi:sulfite exporter TauE/SafE family protein [Luteimonas sp. MJ204]|uniref:sulfite exporter TauE/SafE family protein n=1 Tax=Luteimonas sp. MJ145 TaxID=3129234 RepID=UPI0031BAB42D
MADLLDSPFLLFVAIGLCAQLIDGALGMAYGLVSSSILLAMGMPPAAVSASVHTAEVFTTGVSGAAHGILGNVDRRLMLRLAAPGVVGGVIGASLLSRIDGEAIRPWIHGYLFVLALLILLRAAGRRLPRGEVKRVGVLGFVSGLLDAIGGGGWGPMATSTLLARGGEARTSIGTVSAAEFVVTLAISITFLLSIGLEHWQVILGLLVGGVIAAPLAALLVRHVRERLMLFAVGGLVLAISGVQIWLALAG